MTLTSAPEIEGNGLSIHCATMLGDQDAPVEIHLPHPSFVQLKLYDTSGKMIMELANKELSAGIHQFSIPASQLVSRIYLLSLQTDYGRETMKLVK